MSRTEVRRADLRAFRLRQVCDCRYPPEDARHGDESLQLVYLLGGHGVDFLERHDDILRQHQAFVLGELVGVALGGEKRTQMGWQAIIRECQRKSPLVQHKTCDLIIMSCRARKPYTRVELSFAVLSYIDIAKLDCVMDMIFLGMRKNGLCAFYVAA